MMDFARALADPRRYRAQIERLFDRTLFSGARRVLRQDGVPLESLFDQQRRVGRLLAREVESGRYEFAPGRVREIRAGGKIRDVFSFRLTDLIVHGVTAQALDEAVQPLLSPRLYSYRKGVSWWHAVRDLSDYVREHRRARPDPKDRGLYMIRRDIDSYTDSIPVDPHSPLWPMLWNTLKSRRGAPLPDWTRRALEEIVRPEVFAKSGGRVRHIHGVPTGQPISCVLFNFYLHGLDRRLEAVPGAFYARYSDDLLFVHPDPESVVAAAQMIDETAASLELRIKAEKSLELYVTAPGRASPVRESARPGSSIPFLGAEVWMDGTIGLGREKVRSLLRDLRDRAERTVRAGPGTDLDEAGRAICAVFNRVLRPESGAFRQRSADILRRVVTSRAQLKDLDDKIARIAVRALTGAPESQVFRRVPYRIVRRKWGLVSLCHERNAGAE